MKKFFVIVLMSISFNLDAQIDSGKYSKFYVSVDAQFDMGTVTPTISLNKSYKNISLGIGSGASFLLYEQQVYPEVFVDISYLNRKKKTSPYANFEGGYSFYSIDENTPFDYRYNLAKSGPYIDISFGVSSKLNRRDAILLYLGYTLFSVNKNYVEYQQTKVYTYPYIGIGFTFN